MALLAQVLRGVESEIRWFSLIAFTLYRVPTMRAPHTTNQKRPSATFRRLASRAGLAPLELVISLPLLLCMMALIVNFSHAATWKIRSATNARLAMWRHRPMWNADGDPKPVNYWPPTGNLAVTGATRIPQVDQIWNEPRIAQPWIKGPVFVANGGYLAVRDNRVNEMSEGVSRGTADVSRRYPFMPAMGIMRMHAEHSMLDSVWQFHTMGYAWNEDRRAKGWWQLEDSPDWASYKQIFLFRDSRIRSNPQRELLRPLDRDEDLIRGGYSFDFYAHLNPICNNNPAQVSEAISAQAGFVDRIRGNKQLLIRGVCERMAQSYIQMFQDELNLLSMTPGASQQRVAQLEQWIMELQTFIARLTP